MPQPIAAVMPGSVVTDPRPSWEIKGDQDTLSPPEKKLTCYLKKQHSMVHPDNVMLFNNKKIYIYMSSQVMKRHGGNLNAYC